MWSPRKRRGCHGEKDTTGWRRREDATNRDTHGAPDPGAERTRDSDGHDVDTRVHNLKVYFRKAYLLISSLTNDFSFSFKCR